MATPLTCDHLPRLSSYRAIMGVAAPAALFRGARKQAVPMLRL